MPFLKKVALGYAKMSDCTEQELTYSMNGSVGWTLSCLSALCLCFPALNPVVFDLKGPANMSRSSTRLQRAREVIIFTGTESRTLNLGKRAVPRNQLSNISAVLNW